MLNNFKKNKILKFILFALFFCFIILPITPPRQDAAASINPEPKIIISQDLTKTLSADVNCRKIDGREICTNVWLSSYVTEIYKYALGVVGILATVVMMIGGFIWISSAGNAGQVGEAKAWIGGALTGLVLVLSSYLILYQVNPKTTQMNPITISKIEPITEYQSSCSTIGGHWVTLAEASERGAAEAKCQSICSGEYELSPPDNSGYCCFCLAAEMEKRQVFKNYGIEVNKEPCTAPGQINCTNVSGFQYSTVAEILSLKENCKCAGFVITGGSEGGHASGAYSHAGGYKFDLRLQDDLNNFIKNNYMAIGTRSDGAEQYQSPRGAIYALEGDHWDVLAK